MLSSSHQSQNAVYWRTGGCDRPTCDTEHIKNIWQKPQAITVKTDKQNV